MNQDPHSPQAESEYHDYVTNRIPWYVRLVWVGFWIFAAYYTVTYLFPDLQAQKFLGP
jgi:hypothetical protein